MGKNHLFCLALGFSQLLQALLCWWAVKTQHVCLLPRCKKTSCYHWELKAGFGWQSFPSTAFFLAAIKSYCPFRVIGPPPVLSCWLKSCLHSARSLQTRQEIADWHGKPLTMEREQNTF